MTLQPRNLTLAALLHVALFALLVFSDMQCTPHIEATPVIQGVLINPSDLKQFKPPTPPTPTPPKPDEQNEGPQQIVKDTDVVADEAKAKHEKAEAEQKQADEQKAAEQQQKDAAAKAEELKQQQQAQKEAEQAELLKKQQDDAKRQADAAAAAAAAEQQKKDEEAELRKEAEKEQQAQAAAMAKQKKAEEAKQEADRRKRAAELQASLGVESAQLTQEIQNQWALQLVAAITQVWARPPGTDQNLKAILSITLSVTGQVQSANIATSSGVVAYDDSLKRAVYRASPLPLPQDPSAFAPNVNICFSPNPRNCQ
jgi:colicin import membrane protein